MKKVGILGGSFNPIHNGHIALALHALENFSLDSVILIPAKIPPHKSAACLADEKHRLQMCRIAADGLPLEVSDIELKADGASYSYRTLEMLKALHSDWRLWLICGTDMFMSLPRWRYPERIYKAAGIAGVLRAGDNFDSFEKMTEMKSRLEKDGAEVMISRADIKDISSTEIRNRLKQNRSVDGLINSKVYDYIIENGLYR